jgi:hypothetical protein
VDTGGVDPLQSVRRSHTRSKSQKCGSTGYLDSFVTMLQPSWEGPYQIITRINDVVYRIQKTPRSRMMVVHLDRLAPFQGVARDERT